MKTTHVVVLPYDPKWKDDFTAIQAENVMLAENERLSLRGLSVSRVVFVHRKLL